MHRKKIVSGIIVADNKVLLLDHNKLKQWTIPIGKVDEGESVYAAFHREMDEEVGILVVKAAAVQTTLVPCNILPDVEKWHTVYRVSTYLGTAYNKEPHKHQDMRWVTKEELQHLVSLQRVNTLTIELLRSGLLL